MLEQFEELSLKSWKYWPGFPGFDSLPSSISAYCLGEKNVPYSLSLLFRHNTDLRQMEKHDLEKGKNYPEHSKAGIKFLHLRGRAGSSSSFYGVNPEKIGEYRHWL